MNERYRSQRAEGEKRLVAAQHESLSDQAAVVRIVFRVLVFPIWVLRYAFSRLKRRREMTAFALDFVHGRVYDDRTSEEVAREWIKQHPGDYVLGEYDPKKGKSVLPALRRTFSRILDRNL